MEGRVDSKGKRGAGEMALGLRAHIALTEDLSLVPSSRALADLWGSVLDSFYVNLTQLGSSEKRTSQLRNDLHKADLQARLSGHFLG